MKPKDANQSHNHDDDDDDVFMHRKNVTDKELFKKVSQILQEIVPKSHGGDAAHDRQGHGGYSSDRLAEEEERHLETVRGAVRRFYLIPLIH